MTVHDKIRLIDRLRESPAQAGLFYWRSRSTRTANGAGAATQGKTAARSTSPHLCDTNVDLDAARPRTSRRVRAAVRSPAARVDSMRSGMRWRGFSPLTVLIAVVDLGGALGIGILWWWAKAERPADENPWWAAVAAGAALLALLVWLVSSGRRREALAISTVIVVGSALVVLFG